MSNMHKWNVLDVLKCNISVLKSGTELLLCAAVHRLLQEQTGEGLDLSGIKIHKDLQKGNEIQVLLQSGVILSETVLKGLSVKTCMPFMEFDYESVRSKMLLSNGVYLYQHQTMDDVYANFANLRMCGYLYMCADVIVQNFLQGSDLKLKLIQSDLDISFYEFTDMLILRDYGNCLYRQIGTLEINEYDSKQDWWVYREYYTQLGYTLIQDYKASEKVKYLTQNYGEGTVVSLYSRNINPETLAVLNDISGYNPAVIKKITPEGVYLNKLLVFDTKATREYKINQMLFAEDSIYLQQLQMKGKAYTEVFYSWQKIGIDGYVNKGDRYFMTQVWDTDGREQYIQGEMKQLNTVELVHRLLNDYEVPYNKENYLKMYLKC